MIWIGLMMTLLILSHLNCFIWRKIRTGPLFLRAFRRYLVRPFGNGYVNLSVQCICSNFICARALFLSYLSIKLVDHSHRQVRVCPLKIIPWSSSSTKLFEASHFLSEIVTSKLSFAKDQSSGLVYVSDPSKDVCHSDPWKLQAPAGRTRTRIKSIAKLHRNHRN